MLLPPDALERLQTTHNVGCALIRGKEFEPESFEVAVKVEEHRWHWRPPKPRLVLLAESHVFTTAVDAALAVQAGDLLGTEPLPPSAYVRLIYCLGYGEPALVPNANANGRGTPPFWDLFGRVSFQGAQPRALDGFSLCDRLRWKIKTLRTMQSMGIWLLDASVHAIYRGNGIRLPPDITTDLHRQWWDGYGKFVLQRCPDVKVWVVGKGVFEQLANFEAWRPQGWIYQPHVTGVDLNRNWDRLLEDCWHLR